MDADSIVISTGKGELTLAQLGEVLPGMARHMAEIAPRIVHLRQAAEAGNWPLAAYLLKEAVKTMQAAVVVRPKYEADMVDFITGECDAVLAAISTRDKDAFDAAYAAMLDRANAYHEQYEKAYIRLSVDSDHPSGLDLRPVEQ